MSKSATSLAGELLEGEPGGLEELRVHMFEDLDDDETALDDEFVEQLYGDFSEEFDRVQEELSQRYGSPSRTGEEDDEAIPLNGVFRFAVWNVAGKQLYAAAAQEDCGLPVLLMLGTVA